MDDQVTRLILQVEGEERIKALTERIAEERAELVKLGLEFKEKTLDQDQYAAASRRVGAVMANLQADFKRTQATLAELEAQGMGFKMRGGMRADLVLAHAFREMTSDTASLQQKMESLARTLPYTMAMFGVGGPWLMGLTLAGTAVIELISHWNQLMDFLGNKAPLEAAKNIEEMAERAKAAIKSFTDAVEAPTDVEAASLKALKGLISGPQGREAQDAIAAAMRATGTVQGMPAFAGREMAGQPGLAGQFGLQMQQAYEETLRRKSIEQAQAMLGAATGGKTREEREEALMAIRGLAPSIPGRFGADVAATMPDEIARKEEVKRLNKIDQDRAVAMANLQAKHQMDEKREEQERVAAQHAAERQGQKNIAKDEDEKERERTQGLRRAAAAQEKLTREQLREEREGEAQLRKDEVEARKAVVAGREQMAGRLMEQGPAIVGEAFGPQAAQAASRAKPEEVHAMRAATIRNLEQEQLPYDAVINAFREVFEQSQRNRARGQAFGAQMRGMQGRFQQGGQTAMDR